MLKIDGKDFSKESSSVNNDRKNKHLAATSRA